MELLSSTPVVAKQMQTARRTTEVKHEADFSYSCTHYAGDRWLLAGDAGSFLDPVFSTGVQLALEAGEQAAKAVDAALSNGRARADAFGQYERSQRKRYRHFRRYVRSFYDPRLSRSALSNCYTTRSNGSGYLRICGPHEAELEGPLAHGAHLSARPPPEPSTFDSATSPTLGSPSKHTYGRKGLIS